MTAPGLIADIGGTNARFALVPPGASQGQQPLTLACADFPGPAEAALAYLRKVAPPVPPARAAFAVACPVLADSVAMTNHAWRFSIEEVRQTLSLERLEVVNDFIAVALAVPHLQAADQATICPGRSAPGAPIAVAGPGTGLGVSLLVPRQGRWQAIATEGGHVTMAAQTAREDAILAWLRQHFDHVSAERVLSGPGLANIHAALRGLAGLPPQPLAPADITGQALAGEPLARESLDLFFAFLGTFCGNLALTLGARGGLALAGGILPRLLPALKASAFAERFRDKGRFRDWLAPLPVDLVTHPYPAFVGLAGLVNGEI